jgi:hypothetical protein
VMEISDKKLFDNLDSKPQQTMRIL